MNTLTFSVIKVEINLSLLINGINPKFYKLRDCVGIMFKMSWYLLVIILMNAHIIFIKLDLINEVFNSSISSFSLLVFSVSKNLHLSAKFCFQIRIHLFFSKFFILIQHLRGFILTFSRNFDISDSRAKFDSKVFSRMILSLLFSSVTSKFNFWSSKFFLFKRKPSDVLSKFPPLVKVVCERFSFLTIDYFIALLFGKS